MSEHDSHLPPRPGRRRSTALDGQATRRRRCELRRALQGLRGARRHDPRCAHARVR